uniref:NADH-ubiquinone oxidoreductase chain 4L n=1 Tax=Urosaurus nigricauda TaxID=3148767 RepID=A0A4V1GPJ6_9SAUR|nr:NADH dehydrogenase subunit 4L [Urosaurus nigricaudus]QCT81484.1 NADH dehydrogenase subunit 4L [Urosaurus nigricaudus]QCT81497.1 NADH dehydrogenase subunit 4L [Urosaurus nigricaudus]QCT81510.1 NADH dehydrogenase subunit 4L [Urosaurus nigricaudus]QCT81523.1 NADH dehydrogenase subunit 4L [Urosaurus nigricaudus]
MSPMHFTLNSTFALSIMGFSMHRTHLVSALLCIEGMMLALFTTITMFFSTINLPTMSPAPIMLLAFSACEASTGLALLVATSRTHGNDHLKNLNLLQC